MYTCSPLGVAFLLGDVSKGEYVIRTSVIPCLSYFLDFFGHFGSLAFFENRGTKLPPKQSDRMFLVNFSKVQQLSNNFLKKRGFIS